jgi:hypothetical protein
MLTQAGWRLASLAAFLVGVAAERAQTQARAPASLPDLRMLSLKSLRAGRSIRVGGRDFGTLTGSFAGVRDGSLWLGAEPTGRGVPVAGIDSVWVGHSHATTGAIVGGLVGIVLGAAVISGQRCSFVDNGCMTSAYGTFAGVSLGTTLLGAIIGGATKSWDLRYP